MSCEQKMTELDKLREDLKFQLGTPDELDWDHFVETAIMAQNEARKEGRNMSYDMIPN